VVGRAIELMRHEAHELCLRLGRALAVAYWMVISTPTDTHTHANIHIYI
jgi:hypothetical protein